MLYLQNNTIVFLFPLLLPTSSWQQSFHSLLLPVEPLYIPLVSEIIYLFWAWLILLNQIFSSFSQGITHGRISSCFMSGQNSIVYRCHFLKYIHPFIGIVGVSTQWPLCRHPFHILISFFVYIFSSEVAELYRISTLIC